MPNALRWYAKCSLQPKLWTPRLCTTRFSPLAMSRSELARVCSSLGRIGGRRPACLALSSAPLRYRGITGRWPVGFNGYGRVDDDACIKVVMKPGTSTMYHALSNSSHH